jgi:hypothetical protein
LVLFLKAQFFNYKTLFFEQQVILVRESPNFDEDNADSQEVLDDVICRQLTREYLDVVKAILTSGGGSDLKHDETKVYASSENLSKAGKIQFKGCFTC